ncbi:hypothetical protein ACQP60_08630 [Isoptericola variabilis]|uniref:hypothetical protein n=1 Tax=Isoptericola variabilis TaxID=139208 RepID=UPI003D1B2261
MTTTNSYPTTPDERAALARGVHDHLPEDRRVQIRQDDLERLAEGLPNQFTADETAAALLRWTAPDDLADVPWTASRAGYDAVVAARARREEPRGVFEAYSPRSRIVTGNVMPDFAVSQHDGHTVTHVGPVDVVSLDVAEVPVHWAHETGVRCGALVGIERRDEGLKVWLALAEGELEDRILALTDLGRVGLSAGFNALMTTPEVGAIVGQRRAQGMRLGEVSLTETPAFGMDETGVKRVADVPRFASEALRRERHDEHEVRALEAGIRARGRAASQVQTRYYPQRPRARPVALRPR